MTLDKEDVVCMVRGLIGGSIVAIGIYYLGMFFLEAIS